MKIMSFFIFVLLTSIARSEDITQINEIVSSATTPAVCSEAGKCLGPYTVTMYTPIETDRCFYNQDLKPDFDNFKLAKSKALGVFKSKQPFYFDSNINQNYTPEKLADCSKRFANPTSHYASRINIFGRDEFGMVCTAYTLDATSPMDKFFSGFY